MSKSSTTKRKRSSTKREAVPVDERPISDGNIQKAFEEGFWWAVGAGTKKRTKRSITGAEKYWNSTNLTDQSVIFLPAWRLTGSRKAVERYVIDILGVDREEFDLRMREAITKENFDGSMKDIFEEEVKIYESVKGRKEKGLKMDFESFRIELGRLVDALPDGTVEKSKARPKKGSGKGRTSASPKERYERARKEGKLLDIRKYQSEGKTGFKDNDKWKGTQRSNAETFREANLIAINRKDAMAFLADIYGTDNIPAEVLSDMKASSGRAPVKTAGTRGARRSPMQRARGGVSGK